MPYTLDELEAAFAARIAALVATGTDWDQGNAETWTESDIPLTAVQDSVLQQHLAFSVSVEDAPAIDDGHLAQGFITILATVVVVFVFRLRTDDQLRDQRAAIRAAREVAGAMLRPSAQWGGARPLSIYRPGAIVDGWLPVEQRYAVQIDVSIPTVQ